MTDIEIDNLLGKAEVLKTIGEAIVSVPPNCLSLETLKAFDQAALGLLELINVE